MKKSKILAPALAVLCLSVAASVTGTVAWFAANNVVTATGMQVKSTTPASLVISKTIPVGILTDIDYEDSSYTAISPATWYNNELEYISNGEVVDTDTGLVKSGETASWDTASAGSQFLAYECFIASAGNAITGGTLGVKIAGVTEDASAIGSTLKALSVAFYATRVTSAIEAAADPVVANYKGSLNLAGLDSVTNDGSTTKSTIDDLYVASDAGTSIQGSSSGYGIRVDMYVYFDGALLSDATHAYVRTNSINTKGVELTITFTGNITAQAA